MADSKMELSTGMLSSSRRRGSISTKEIDLVSGLDPRLRGDDSVVSGDDSVVSGDDSVVSGDDSVVSGDDSVVSGDDSVVSGDDSVVSGDDKDIAYAWFTDLRNQICAEFELIEQEFGGDVPAGKFERKDWQRDGGGGGEMSVMRGRVFEKVGVNISKVFGAFTPEFSKNIPGTENNPNFFACGISLVAHMCSPLVPAVHFNTRYIVTKKSWFGGGTDLTPMYENAEDTKFFHNKLRQMCDRHDSGYYRNFKKQCDEYFYLPHRNEPRGVGGIFYDYHNSGSFAHDLAFTKDLGMTFTTIYAALVRKHMHKKWSVQQRDYQLIKRGRYVEFNLLYDRGTTFGLKTGGNVEAILMSLPPEVKWP